ncbi:MAG: signal peptidase I [Alphaproteobacteria bacterium]
MKDGDTVAEARPGGEDEQGSGGGAPQGADARPVRRRRRRSLGDEIAALPLIRSLSPQTRHAIWDNVKTIGLALLIALVLRTFLFQPFNIPSGSMKSTLLVGDYLFVSKYSYGYSRYSFPFGLAPIEGRIFSSNPERGDIAVFKNPADNRDFIKRVIGLPGDRIQMIEGTLHVNGKPVRMEYVGEYVDRDEFGRAERLFRYRETLPNGVSYAILRECPVTARCDAYSTREFVVPADHFFMMGDNRDNSDDSRRSVGYVPRENLVGKAQVLFLSTESAFWAVWDWRWNRFFKDLD